MNYTGIIIGFITFIVIGLFHPLVIKGEYYHPATNALWFYAPSGNASCKTTWFNQANAGRYKNHCFYEPSKGTCKELH